ncbi:hypothetical protein BT96DRAFT_925596 [Gymnopus androsaceus JB14]|uniref:Uncharacterized protein n=1 Tax=Gymnopus androsaceus JB14 TaxID=1447944 RepID=A0A6A4GYJ0_9AGAR|nr:hypothetical protein BT96DRAFT_925596 [Gymnopus androsaceus JB14]
MGLMMETKTAENLFTYHKVFFFFGFLSFVSTSATESEQTQSFVVRIPDIGGVYEEEHGDIDTDV